MRSLLRTDEKSCLMYLKCFQRNDFILQEVTLFYCHESSVTSLHKASCHRDKCHTDLSLTGFWSLVKTVPLSFEITLFSRWRMIPFDLCTVFINWVAAGTVAELCCVPSLILVLDFPPIHHNSAAVAQNLGILVMILVWLFSGAIHLMLLHLFLGILDVSCNAGDVT